MNGNRLSPEPDRRSFATIYLDLLDQFPRWSQTGTVSTICLLGYFIMILVVILLIVFINFWCLFAQVFDRGHVCRNSVVLIAYIFDEIYLMPLILLNSALWDSVPDGSLQWSSSFLVSVCVCFELEQAHTGIARVKRGVFRLCCLLRSVSSFSSWWGIPHKCLLGGALGTGLFAHNFRQRKHWKAQLCSHTNITCRFKGLTCLLEWQSIEKNWKIGNR